MMMIYNDVEWMNEIGFSVVWLYQYDILLLEGVCCSGMPYAGKKLQSVFGLVSEVTKN